MIDDRHVGFQCHIEMTRDLVDSLVRSSAPTSCPRGPRAQRQSAADMQSDLDERLAALGEVADGGLRALGPQACAL